jgi:hypothetical protein
MPKPVLGRFHMPQSIAQLSRGRGWNSELVGFLLPFATRDYFYQVYDFKEEDAINADWAVANSSGTSAADFAPTADTETGIITGDTGTDDNGAIGLGYDLAGFDAARNPGFETRIQVDIITGQYLEFAVCDPPTNLYAINVSDIDVPTQAANGVTDFVGCIIDTDQTHKGAALVTVGTTDAVAKTLMGATPGAHPFAAALYSVVLVQAFANKGYAIIDDNLSAKGEIATGPDTGVLMRPQIVVATRSVTAVFPKIDYIRMWSERKP